MPVNVEWDNTEQTVIRQTFIDPWTLDEHRDSLLQISQMVASQSHTVHCIADMRQSHNAPGKLLLNIRFAESIVQPNTGLLFIVRPSAFIRSILGLSKNLMPRVLAKMHLVYSMKEAHQIIEAYTDPAQEPA